MPPQSGYTSWSRVESDIYRRLGKESWYGDVLSYLDKRYHSIENRMMETFRYVDCHPGNRNTFSYEYASILRDAGSVFGSVMDRLVKETSSVSGQLDIRDYRKWLRQLNIKVSARSSVPPEKIHSIAAEINLPLEERLLLPFLPLKDQQGRLEWWDAYNDVKHSDIDKFRVGNFGNALNSVAALAILFALSAEENRIVGQLFTIGFYAPEDYVQNHLFF